MNDFDEDKWSADQRDLDAQITRQFEGLEGSFASHEATGAPIEAWLASAREIAASLRRAAAKLEHKGRREHWNAELTRLGLPAPTPPPAPPPASVTVDAPKAARPKGGAASNA